MADLRGLRVTIRYDRHGKLVGWGSRKGASAVLGAEPEEGAIQVDGDIFEDYRKEMGDIHYLRVKNRQLTIPRRMRFVKKYHNFMIWFYHQSINYKFWKERQSFLLGQTVFGQIFVVSIISFFFLAGLKYFILSEQIKIYNYWDFVRYYLPILSAFFVVAFGAIGINGANHRFRESRKHDIEPVFVINAREEVKSGDNILKLQLESEPLSLTKDPHESAIKRQNYSIVNEGRGTAFNVWAFMEKEQEGYKMIQLFNLSPGERVDVTFSRLKDEKIPSYFYFIYSDVDGNSRVTSFYLNANLPNGKPVSTTVLKPSDPRFKDINYQSARFFGSLYGKR